MAWQRKIPFGYKMIDGEIVPYSEEVDAIAFIYDSYLRGDSYQMIANIMSELGIHYHQSVAQWNKHMVKRILANPKYIGSSEYPGILPEDTWYSAQDIRSKKTATWKSQPICIEMVKRCIFCKICGSAISKYTKVNRRGRSWHCSNQECSLVLTMKDDILEKIVVTLLNRLIIEPDLLKPQKATVEHHTSQEAIRMQNEINRELSKTDINEEYLNLLILGCAAEKYTLLDDGSEERKIFALKAVLRNRKLLSTFDSILFNEAVEAVLIMPDKTIALQILGGNNISENEKEDLHHGGG